MALVKCVRCDKEREGLTAAPIHGPLGGGIVDKVCAACWGDWLGVSTKIINEYRLQLFRPEHRKVLEEQMRLFLKLPD